LVSNEGIKNSEIGLIPSSNESSEPSTSTDNLNSNNNIRSNKIHRHEEPSSLLGVEDEISNFDSPLLEPQSIINDESPLSFIGQNRSDYLEANTGGSFFKFNGYSNSEIFILFSLAFMTYLVFEFNQADLIYRVNYDI